MNLVKTNLHFVKPNLVTKNKSKISGVKNCASSEELTLSKVKLLSKQLGVTINDLMTSSISIGLSGLFEENGDP
jgi:hypothetical protein